MSALCVCAIRAPSGDQAGFSYESKLPSSHLLIRVSPPPFRVYRLDLEAEVAVVAGEVDESDLVAARGPVGDSVPERHAGAPGTARASDLLLPAAVDVHPPHILNEVAELVLLGSYERELRAVRRPGRVGIEDGVVGEPRHLRAVGVHAVDLVATVPAARERDLCAVRRPGRMQVRGGIVGEVRPARAVRVHHVDLVVAVAAAGPGDFRPVR
jgi:hypothetical protein